MKKYLIAVLFVLGIITMFVFTYVVTIANTNNVSKKNNNESIAKIAMPMNIKNIIKVNIIFMLFFIIKPLFVLINKKYDE